MKAPMSFFRYALLGLCTWTLGACSNTPPPPSMPGPEGQLTIMGNGTALNLDAPPRDWIISGGGEDRASAITSVNRDGVAALEIRSGPERVIVVRQVDAMLLATPFLSWTWNLSNHGAGIHPVRLVVGFKGGAPEDSETTNQGDGLPEHDRAIVLAWGDTALKRGTLSLPPPERPFEAPVYTVRGGRENTRRWWNDAVDLSDLYTKAWPNDNSRHARIAFIGLAAAPSTKPVRGRISNILLMR